MTSYSLIIDKKLVKVVIRYVPQTSVTTLKLGKHKVIKKGSIQSLLKSAIHLTVPEYNVKVYTVLNPDGKSFLLNVNG